MTDQSLPAVLRRRIETLKADGYNDQFLRTLVLAADLVELRGVTELESLYFGVVHDNRRLRNVLRKIPIALKGQVQKVILALVQGAINAVPEPEIGRPIMGFELQIGEDRASIEARVKATLDAFFGRASAPPAAKPANSFTMTEVKGDAPGQR